MLPGFSVYLYTYFPFHRLERLRCPVVVSSACRLLGQNLVIAIYLIIFEKQPRDVRWNGGNATVAWTNGADSSMWHS